MRHQKPLVVEAGCGNCPAYQGPAASNGTVRNLTRIPSQMVAQMTDNTWHAMLTSVGKGKFLIRRRKNPTANTCPLLNYDIRHIDADGAPSQPPAQKSDGDPAGNRKTRVACRELLLLVLMGQI